MFIKNFAEQNGIALDIDRYVNEHSHFVVMDALPEYGKSVRARVDRITESWPEDAKELVALYFDHALVKKLHPEVKEFLKSNEKFIEAYNGDSCLRTAALIMHDIVTTAPDAKVIYVYAGETRYNTNAIKSNMAKILGRSIARLIGKDCLALDMDLRGTELKYPGYLLILDTETREKLIGAAGNAVGIDKPRFTSAIMAIARLPEHRAAESEDGPWDGLKLTAPKKTNVNRKVFCKDLLDTFLYPLDYRKIPKGAELGSLKKILKNYDARCYTTIGKDMPVWKRLSISHWSIQMQRLTHPR